MLNKETKDKIFRCRDILVGQLPLPSDQVELITITLIYKFMDDMDEQSRRLGGKASFFKNGLSDFSWQKLMSNQLSGEERVSKFIQAIESITKAPHIPELFKSIFINTFLKFRDARTLKLFLDEINTFNYDHSEELGNAFEFLLSSMGTQAENGQFRTPRHIIDFIVEVVDPDKTDKILDPACGTAGFLISAYKHILRKNTTGYENYRVSLKNYEIEGLDIKWGDKLKLMEKEKISKQVAGYDITPLMVRLSQVNMYLHHFPNPSIHDYDTLTNQNRWNDKFDCIFANPPFMTPRGGVKPHDKFMIRANKAEILFSDYILEHLTPNGKAGWIVPEGIIFQNSNDYVKLRKWMINTMGLWAVVSLPAQIFQPYSGVKTSILFVDRAFARIIENIIMVKVENDGFSLNTNRTPIKTNDLPAALNLLTEYKVNPGKFTKEGSLDFSKINVKAKALNRKEFEKLDSYRAFSAAADFVKKNFKKYEKAKEKQKNKIEKEFLLQTGLSRLPENEDEIKKLVTDELKESAVLFGEDRINSQGIAIELQKYIDSKREYNLSFDKYVGEKKDYNGSFERVPLHEVCNIEKGSPITKQETCEGSVPVIAGGKQPAYYHNIANRNGEVITISASGAHAGYINFYNIPIFASDCTTLQSKVDNLKTRFLFYLLKNKQGDFYKLQKGGGQPHVYAKDFADMLIPLPPLEIHEKIVAEIEGYQKVTDGCNLVIENYKPSFKIDEKWERVRLGTILTLEYGKSLKKENRIRGDFPVFGSNGIVDFHNSFLVKAPFIVVGRKGSAGEVVFSEKNGFPIDTTFFVNLIDSNKVNLKYLFFNLKKLNLSSLNNQAGVPGINRNDVYDLTIPLPPLEIQEKIVAEIEGYQKVIDGCNLVIENYKPSFKINEKWGKVKLEEICVLITDGTHLKPTYIENGIKFLSAKNVVSGRIDWENIKYISEEEHQVLSRRILPQRDDILLAKNGTTGVAALNDTDEIFDIYVSLAVLRPSKSILPAYLYHSINSDIVKEQFDSRLLGIGVPNLHLNQIKDVEIYMPTIEKQIAIVEQLQQETEIIDQTRFLKSQMEQKIKEVIDKIWHA